MGTLGVDYFLWAVIYGFNAAFTTFVCIGWIILEGPGYGLSYGEIGNLGAIYAPYLLIPFWIMVDSMRRIRGLKAKTD